MAIGPTPSDTPEPRRSPAPPELARQLAFWRPAFLLDYLVLVGLAVLAYYTQFARPYEHDVRGRLNDPSLSYKHVYNETVPVVELWTLSFDLPLIVTIALGLLRVNVAEVHSGVLSYLTGWHLMNVFVGFAKNHAGRLRPDFLDRCQFDLELNRCTGDPYLVMEGRRSFPSGHSACSFYASVFLVLFLAGKTRSLCFASQGGPTRSRPTRLTRWSTSHPMLSILQSKVFRLSYTLSPILIGTYVAISRYEDHWHHPSDIATGSVLGAIFATLSYHVFWPSPFVPSNAPWMSQPRALYVSADEGKEENDERTPLLNDATV